MLVEIRERKESSVVVSACNILGPWEAGAGGLCVAVQLGYPPLPCQGPVFLKQTNKYRGVTGEESRDLDPGCVIKVWPLRLDEGLHVGVEGGVKRLDD